MVRCREIGAADLGIADFPARGFPIRSRDCWIDGRWRLSARDMPDSFPRFGYMLEHDGLGEPYELSAIAAACSSLLSSAVASAQD